MSYPAEFIPPDGSEASAVAKIAREALVPIPGIDPLRYGIAAAAGNVVNFRDLLPPTTQRAIRYAMSTKSYIDLVGHEMMTETTVTFADPVNARFEAVIDYGTQAEPSRDEHIVEYTPRPHEAWIAWTQLHGRWIDQSTFANMIEENLDTVIDPPGADLLELIQDVRGHKNVEFQSARRLQTGETQVQYIETVATSGSGKTGLLTIPAGLRISTPIFQGEEAVEFEAFLRYRIKDSDLALQVKIKQMPDITRDALEAIAAQIRSGLPDLLVIEGWHR